MAKKEVTSTMAWQLLGLKKDTFYRLSKRISIGIKKEVCKIAGFFFLYKFMLFVDIKI